MIISIMKHLIRQYKKGKATYTSLSGIKPLTEDEKDILKVRPPSSIKYLVY